MEQQNDWTYLYPSLGLIMRILKAEKKKYYNGFVRTPNGEVLTYSDAVDAYKAFLVKVLGNNADSVALASYDFTTTYYAICYLSQILDSNHSHFQYFRTIAEDEKRIHFDEAYDLFKSFVRLTFKFE